MFYFWNGKGNYTKNDFLCIKQGIIIGGVSFEKSIHPLSKDTASYADEGASVADGQGIVVAHAHGQFLEFGCMCKVRFLYFVEETA